MKNFLMAAALICTVMSCGGGSESSTTSTTDTASSSSTEEATTDAKQVFLTLNGNDQMQYDLNELRVKEGQQVNLTLKHSGQMPVEVMGHNFVLLKPGTDIAALATAALEYKDNDYIPESDAIIVHTKMIGGGEQTSIRFDAPAKGTYDYICTFPGHYALMKGKLIVG